MASQVARNLSASRQTSRTFCRSRVRSATSASRTLCKLGEFAKSQELYRLAVREKKVLEIKDQCPRFLFGQGPKFHILPCNLAADAQDHKTLSDANAFDSASHCRFTVELIESLTFPSRACQAPDAFSKRRVSVSC